MNDYHAIKSYYENCLDEHGNSPLGVDWPDETSMFQRFQVMHDLVQHRPASVLDIGCGLGFYLDYLKHTQRLKDLEYTGIDISEKMIASARARQPEARWICRDIIADPLKKESYDCAIMNGVLTVREGVSRENMFRFMREITTSAFNSVKVGLAFNVMSTLVDWEKDRLLHVGFDEVAQFVSTELSRHFVIRHDYGLWEYTIHVYKNPVNANPQTFIHNTRS